MTQFLRRGSKGLYVDTIPPPSIDDLLDTIEVKPKWAITVWNKRGFGIQNPTLRLYEALTLYYENCPSPITRADIARVADQWKEKNLMSHIPPTDGSLLTAVWAWLDKNTDDVDSSLADAIELFQRRSKIGPYTPK